MAQYYQVTSLEELHHLYPNLQLENVEGVQCMIQEDQFSDVQGQQILATVDQENVHLTHNSIASQCKTLQNQYIVQQPTQYVIQQIDANEPHTEAVQFVQQNRQQMPNQIETEIQMSPSAMRCIRSNLNQSEHSLKQCILKSDGNKQFVAQVQPIIQQPIQIHQQLQAVDVGTNILVLQNQDQELIMGTKQVECVENQSDNHHHIVIQKQQQSKLHTIDAQIHQMAHRSEGTHQHYVRQQSENSHKGEHHGNHVDQQIIHPLQYYNQVTVIDGFTPSTVAVERPINESLGHQQQLVSQVPHHQQQSIQDQFKPRKILTTAGVTAVFQSPPRVVIPQRFEMSSPPPLNTKASQHRKKMSPQQESGVTSPVLIVQKLDSPLIIRQPQTKIRCQNSNSSDENVNENSSQTHSAYFDKISKTIVTQASEDINQAKPTILRQVISTDKIIGLQNQSIKFTTDNALNIEPVKVGIIENPQTYFGNHQVDNSNKTNISSTAVMKTLAIAASRIKTSEQQTESNILNSGKEVTGSQVERFGNNIQCQTSTPQPHIQLPTQHSTSAAVNRGRGTSRETIQVSGIRHQCSPKGRGVQVQTSPPRLSAEGSTPIRGSKSTRGGKRGGKAQWNSCASNQRSISTKLETAQVEQTIVESSGNQNSKEIVEETRVLVLLLNGEKKLIRIPSSQQSIFLGQILQQAGLTITSPTSVAVEQMVDISGSEQFVSKSTNICNQSSVCSKAPIIGQSTSSSAGGESTTNIIATIQQPQQCMQTSRLQQVSVSRHMEMAASRVATSTSVQTIVPQSNFEIINSNSQTPQNVGLTSQSLKEEPRFVSGYMAICPFCGIQSLDFNKCIRCRRKLPENVKAKPIFNDIRIKSDKATAENEKTSDKTKNDGDEKQYDSSSSEGKEKSLLRLNNKKKIRPCVKKKKITDEPTEILILSSDEEEDGKVKKTDLNKQNLMISKKEPVYLKMEVSEKEMTNIFKETSLNEDLMKCSQLDLFTTLPCRTVRVGSYKIQPKERILISNKGIKFAITSIKNESVVLVIPLGDIVKMLVHFGKQIPVIFIYPQPKIGVQIRNKLGMDNNLGPYYDPTSNNESHKRIILLLEKISEESKLILNKIFTQEKLEELSEKEANEILLRASPPDTLGVGHNRPTDQVRKILVYPPPPEKGGITLNNQDYACLGEDQFLNDVIIDFYLKYLMLRILSPEDRNRTHVFSTFFYKRLTTKPKTVRKNDPENDPTLSPAEKRHMRVKGWTKQVNLFEKDFIIVPINEHSHWFLAIICFPGLTGPVKFSDNTPVEPEEVTLKKNSETVQIGNTTITHIIKTDGNTISLELDCGFDRDEAEGDQDDLHPSSDDEENEQTEEEGSINASQVEIPLLTPTPQMSSSDKDLKTKPVKRKLFKEPIKQPCILIFDSLAGASRVRVVATLRDYLKIEYKAKMGQERDFSKDTIKGAVPRVPQQNNFTDCGLYVLQYVESFFQDPLHDFKLPLKYLQEWFPEEVVSCKRQKLATLIRNLMEEQGINVDEMGLPVFNFTNGNVTGENQTPVEEEEDEDDEETNVEEEGLKHRIHISEFDNEDEEDMEMGGEEEEDDEDVDEDEDEELEIGEIPKRWLSKNACVKLNTSDEKGESLVMKSSSLVDYDESESEGEAYSLSHSSKAYDINRLNSSSEMVEHYCDSRQSVVVTTAESNVLGSALQEDFESQISCTTIDKNMDCKNSNDSDMVISDDEDCELAVEEEEVSVEAFSGDCSFVSVKSSSKESVSIEEEKAILTDSKEFLLKENKTPKAMNIVKKIIGDKNTTVSGEEEEEEDSNDGKSFKKDSIKQVNLKNCDISAERNCESSSSSTSPMMKMCEPGQNLTSQKRTFQALKSVRIPKKAERPSFDVSGSKRQKVDET